MHALDYLYIRRRYRTISRIITICLAAIFVWSFSVATQENSYGVALAFSAALAGLSIFELFLADILIDIKVPRQTAQMLERLNDRLVSTSMGTEIAGELSRCISTFEGCASHQISATVHIKVGVIDTGTDAHTNALVQVIDYTKPQLGGRRFRFSDPAKGIIGRCLRTDKTVWVTFQTEAEYLRRMVEEFGYTAEEAAQHTSEARSYLAHPLRSNGEIVGVLYFFSTEPQVFPAAASQSRLDEAAQRISSLLRVAQVF